MFIPPIFLREDGASMNMISLPSALASLAISFSAAVYSFSVFI